MKIKILPLLSVLFAFMAIPVFSAEEQAITFDNANEVYKELNEKIKIRHTPVPQKVRGIENPVISLNGQWMFSPKPAEGFEKSLEMEKKDGWLEMPVPGEWYMHGQEVEKEKWAGYFRTLDLPASWNNHKVVIRFGAVESECRVFINGSEAGTHIGSMTPFEMDISPLLKPGKNTIALHIRSESKASDIAHISHYANHQVGGIIRSVELVALPQTSFSELYTSISLSDDLKKAGLKVNWTLDGKDTDGMEATFILRKRGVEGLPLSDEVVAEKKVPVRAAKDSLEISVDDPELWHAERPYLYTLEARLADKDGLSETVVKNIGFRKISMRDNVLTVNNKPVKLRGVARHDITPYEGRVVSREILEQDIKLFRDGNCNFIRTAHYTPDEYLLELCDRYGIFVEEEGSVCWENVPWVPSHYKLSDRERAGLILANFKSMVLRDRDHPSILQWSIANESKWTPYFSLCLLFARETTPEILVKFSHSEYFGIKRGLDVGTRHYPGWKGILQYDNYFRPIVFDEALHLNCYNTSENITDPGMRDMWGEYVKYAVDNIQDSPAIMGLGIWSGIDEMFYPLGKTPIGAGPWGLIDGFRREKPEYWNMKMAYSPVQVVNRHFQDQNGQTFVTVENRFNAENLENVDIVWKDGDTTGKATCKIEAGKQGTLVIPHKMTTDTLELQFLDKRGFTISEWSLPRDYHSWYTLPSLASEGKPVVSNNGDELEIKAGAVTYSFSKASGMPVSITKNGKEIIKGATRLYAVPLLKENEAIDFIPLDNPDRQVKFVTEPLQDWKLESMATDLSDSSIVKLEVKGSFGKTPVIFNYKINASGGLYIDYSLNMKTFNYECRQVGIGFDLPREMDQLKWKRRGLWSAYPADHIARTEGETPAFYPETLVNYYAKRETPAHAYNRDGTPFGSNDFRSTKKDIIFAELSDGKAPGIRINSNGRQHFRSWVQQDKISFLLAHYACGGNEHYLTYDSTRTRYNLKDQSGEFIGWIYLQF